MNYGDRNTFLASFACPVNIASGVPRYPPTPRISIWAEWGPGMCNLILRTLEVLNGVCEYNLLGTSS